MLQRGIQFTDQAGAACDQGCSDSRQLNLTGRPIEKLQAEFTLELANREANGALRKPEFIRRAAETSVPRDSEKCTDCSRWRCR